MKLLAIAACVLLAGCHAKEKIPGFDYPVGVGAQVHGYEDAAVRGDAGFITNKYYSNRYWMSAWSPSIVDLSSADFLEFNNNTFDVDPRKPSPVIIRVNPQYKHITIMRNAIICTGGGKEHWIEAFQWSKGGSELQICRILPLEKQAQELRRDGKYVAYLDYSKAAPWDSFVPVAPKAKWLYLCHPATSKRHCN